MGGWVKRKYDQKAWVNNMRKKGKTLAETLNPLEKMWLYVTEKRGHHLYLIFKNL